ncbi:unnamed protein product [Coregonus sp. 'balchen']|nr:unnamed protein product [Coregonus sp. 'balchen']
MSFRQKSRLTDAEYNGDENRNRGPSRWSNCRKRGADGSMRSNGDLDSTGTSDLKKSNVNHRPVSFTTPESEGPVPRCADWGSEVETDERRSSVRRDMQRSAVTAEFPLLYKCACKSVQLLMVLFLLVTGGGYLQQILVQGNERTLLEGMFENGCLILYFA